MTQKVKVIGKSLALAKEKAASMLGVNVDQLEHSIISQTDAGFLSFLGGRKVEISAWKRNVASMRESEDSDLSKEPLSVEEQNRLIEDVVSFCSGICGFIVNRSGIEVSAKLEGDRLSLDIKDEEIAQQISKNTRLAESMEHLLRKKPRYLKRELPFRIFVDAQGIRVHRESELIEMARDLSAKVAENQKPIVLNYKSSYDRKIIHMALDQDDRVYTKSIGSGASRKLMILPAKNAHGSDTTDQ
jgi:spoIIIJ-associated protein